VQSSRGQRHVFGASTTRSWPGTVLVLGALFTSATGHAGRPPPAAGYWAGLDPAAERAPARGVLALRPAIGGRVRVEGGSFVMGSSPADLELALELCRKELAGGQCAEILGEWRNQEPAHDVSVSAFAIDQREVTVEEYARCVSSGACKSPSFSPGDARFDRPHLPVTHVRWEDAHDYCVWAGGRLPTEAEWEFSARGTTSRQFPWGEVYNPHLCNHGALAPDETDGADGFFGLAPVASFPDGATPLRVFDLAGNVAEWVSDFYAPDRETGFGYPLGSQNNPTGPSSGISHVIRGGSYMMGAAWMRAAWRGATELLDSPFIGFRCAANAT
jgi:sulfatase modifying factor 1